MISFLKKKERHRLRMKKKHRRLSILQLQLLIGICITLCITLLITATWYITRISSLQITQVQVTGGETVSQNLVESKASSALKGTYLRLVPKNFLLFYPKDEIVESIKSINRVKNVRVKIVKNQTLAVVFEEYVPYALWCGQISTDPCVFIDDTGFAFTRAPTLEGNALVRYSGADIIPAVDTTAFDSEFVTETKEFIQLLKESLSLHVTHVAKVGAYDIDYFILGGGIIKVSQTITTEKTFNNLKTVLSSESFEDIEAGTFQYIDLRFGDKIFVNEELPSEGSTDTSQATSSNPQ